MARKSVGIKGLIDGFLKEVEEFATDLLDEGQYEELRVTIERNDKGKYPNLTFRVREAAKRVKKVTR